MKKINIFMLGLLAVATASCEKDLDPSFPQENPQGPIVNVSDVVSNPAGVLAGASHSLTLEDYNTPGAQIQIMAAPTTENLPAGATVSYRIELSNTDTFERSQTLNAVKGETAETENNYYVNAEDWNSVHVYMFGKSPKVKEMHYRVIGYVDLDESNYLIGGKDRPYVVEGTIEETCFDTGFTISDNYYFLGNATTWDLGAAGEDAYKFAHDPDVSPYDDPVFTYSFKVTQDVIDGGGCYWKIASQEGVDESDWSKVVGTEVDGDESLDGYLVAENAEAGKLMVAGNYKLTINMEEMTYSFQLLLQPEELYTPGDSNGWAQLESGWMQLGNKGYYYGVFPVTTGGFKICTENSWDDSVTYGVSKATGSEVTEEGYVIGELALGGAGDNITVPSEDEGLCWINVDYDPVSYDLTKFTIIPVKKVGLIGSFAASGWGSDVEMTSEDGGKTWTGEVEFAAGNEFKVRFNSNWDYNLGGDIKGLSLDGSNIVVEDAGNYTVTLTLMPGVPTLTLTKK